MPSSYRIRVAFPLILLNILSINVFASDTNTPSTSLEDLVIEGESAPRHESIGRPEVEISGSELKQKVQATIGETLSRELGVHNTSYGPGVGLPVIRGLSGVRVHVSEDGLSTWDASVISPDHASTIEPGLADTIRLIRGPSTVLYGNGAIGGAVLVESGRIASSLPKEQQTFDINMEREVLNDSERFSSSAITKLRVNNWVFHLDGAFRENREVSIPGTDLDTPAIIEQFGFQEQDIAATHDKIPNSDADSVSYSMGMSRVSNNGYIGVSSRILTNNYGIPSGLHVHPEGGVHVHEDTGKDTEAIRIELEQQRLQLRGGWFLSGNNLIREIEWNLGHLDYEHKEFEQGLSGTLFSNDVIEFKGSLFHQPILGFDGQMGFQFFDRELSAVGEENFVPKTKQTTIGIFLSETYVHQYGEFQMGARYEKQLTEQKEPTAPFGTAGDRYLLEEIKHTTGTVFTGINFSPLANHFFELNLSQSSRAPDIQEQLALGPHLATYSFDIGYSIRHDDLLDPETILSADIGWTWDNRFGIQKIYLFQVEADDYIYQQRLPFLYDFTNTGANFLRINCVQVYGCLPVYEYQQKDARFHGYEWQWHFPDWNTQLGSLQLVFSVDQVTAKFKDGNDIPRIPPMRAAAELSFNTDFWYSQIRMEDVSAQNNPGELETDTAGFQKVDLIIERTLQMAGVDHCVLRFKARNLFDEEIRNATSFLRNLTPEPGREISLGLAVNF